MRATIRGRCTECGGPLDERGECPDRARLHQRTPDVYVPPPKPPEPPTARYPVGHVVTFPWPTTGAPTLGIVASLPDMDGAIGLMVVAPNVRINQDDVGRN